MARQAHPAGLCICPPGREAEWLAPMEPSVLPGLSPQCRERIRRYAFTSVGKIQALGREAIAARFGEEGDKLYTLACGLDLARVAGKGGKGGGIRAETVLQEDLNDDDALARVVRLTADKLAFRLREGGYAATKLIVAIRYSDHRSVRKTLKVAPATDSFEALADLALGAFRGLYTRRVALRAVVLAVDRPEAEKGQVDLFEGLADRRAQAIGDALTRIRVKRGFAVIGRGSAQAALQQNIPYS
jgi:DNA polymerase-4